MSHKLELLRAIVIRDIQARYAQSVVGVGWGIIQPLTMMFVFTIVFGKLLKTDTEGFPYPVFVYACLVPWTFFATALGKGTTSIVLEGNIIKKVSVSRYLFPVAAVLACFVDFLASATIFIALVIWYHVPITPWVLMVVPITILQIVLLIGLSLFLSSLNAYVRDIHFVVPLITHLWLYASPIVYSITVVPSNLMWAYRLNPLAGIMDGYRSVLVKGVAPDWELLGFSALITAGVVLVGYIVFSRLEGNFADIV